MPLIISAPGLPGGAEVHSQVRLVDIMPTVLEMLGMTKPPSDGESLVEFFKGDTGVSRPAYSETFFPEEKRAASGYSHLQPLGSIRLDEPGRHRQKVVWEHGGTGVEVYDLR